MVYKICLVNPFLHPYEGESYHFYLALKYHHDIILSDFDQADYLFFINDVRRLERYDNRILDPIMVEKINNHRNYHKEIIIDYNDWTIINHNAPKLIRNQVYKYFKRSIIDKKVILY